MSLKIAIICIGDELLKGLVANTHSAFVGRLLFLRGVLLHEVLVLPDDRIVIADAVRRLSTSCDFLILTGGLGPTTDDLTREAVCDCLGCGMSEDILALEKLQESWQKRFPQVAYPQSNRRQVLLLEGATKIPNHYGAALGQCIHYNNSVLFLLPGPPKEMQPMFESFVLPMIDARLSKTFFHDQVSLFGEPESSVGDQIEFLHLDAIEVAYCAHQQGLTLYIKGDEKDVVDRVKSQLSSLFSHAILKTQTVAEDLILLLKEKKLTVCLAESCTGGRIAAELTQHADVSNCFLGGIVAYSNEVKTSILKVDSSIIEEHGAVSYECCSAMLKGAVTQFGADCAIAVTGIAGPSGGTVEKPVGTVYIGVKYGEQQWIKCYHFYGERQRVQHQSMLQGLFNLCQYIKQGV